MNLSHVERYFSDFLSAMESDEEIPLYKISKDGDSDEELDVVIPESIRLPKNLFVTGTVNIDETTYMLALKYWIALMSLNLNLKRMMFLQL